MHSHKRMLNLPRIEESLTGLKAAYLDDVVVFPPDFNSHVLHLEEVFWRLHQHGLKFQPKKCHLFQQEVTS